MESYIEPAVPALEDKVLATRLTGKSPYSQYFVITVSGL